MVGYEFLVRVRLNNLFDPIVVVWARSKCITSLARIVERHVNVVQP